MKTEVTIEMFCPCCMETHQIKTLWIEELNKFKGVEFNAPAKTYYCEKTDEYFEDENMMSENDILFKDAYREKCGLLTSKEIAEIRSQYNISQSDLCSLLGWGGKTITRYEGHHAQDKAHDSILRKLRDDPEWFIELLDKAKNSLSSETYEKSYKAANSQFTSKSGYYYKHAIEAHYAKYSTRLDYNGNQKLNLNKVVDVIRFFSNSNSVTSLYKVKLMKLMWYSDMLSYRDYGHSITGLTYLALPMGAVPIEHESIIRLPGINVKEVEFNDGGTGYRFSETKSKKYKYLSKSDCQILERVIEKLGSMTREQIVDYMHKEKAFKETKANKPINYKYARYLNL